MTDDLLRVQFRRDGAAETLDVSGELDISTASVLENAVAGTLDGQGDEFRLDVSAMTFMDSTGARSILRVNERLRGLGRRLVVVSPTPAVLRVLELLGLDQILDIEPPKS
jgi:anti-anti-sigma factor